jgi:hypothetical protein
LVMERQLTLNRLDFCIYLLYPASNNITAEGLRLMPNCIFS